MEKIKEKIIITEKETTAFNAEEERTDDVKKLLHELFINAGRFETKNENEASIKDALTDAVIDAQMAVHEEKKSNNPADLYAAYATLHEAQKYCSKVKDFGIEKAMAALRRRMKEKYDLTPEIMKTTNEEITSRQEKILNEGRDFYEKSAEETEKNLTEFFNKTETEPSATKENTGNKLLKYLEKDKKASKILCAVTLSMAMGGIFFGKESKAEAGNEIQQTMTEEMEDDVANTIKEAGETIEETMKTAAEKTSETIKIAQDKFKELQKSVGEKMKELGLFAKLGLINDLKKNSNEILEVLKNNDYKEENEAVKKLLDNGNKNLRAIIDMYFRGLKEIQEIDPAICKEAAKKLETLIRDTTDLSLGELKAKYLG